MGGILAASGIGGGANSNEGASGAKFNATSAQISSPYTAAQANQLYDQSQAGIAQQQAFLNALQGQNGIGNQSAVYNQLAGVANGQGPNPAQAMLANATGSNVANQAALMAGQRGSGANVGLIGRQAAQQGANTQQQAVGQGAALQAQQSLGALGQMGGIAGQQVGQQGNALGNLNQFTQQEQQNVLNSIQGVNNANVANQSNMNNANAGIAQGVLTGQQAMMSNLMGGGGAAVGMPGAGGAKPPGGAGAAALAHGGEVEQNYDVGGEVSYGGPQSFVGKWLNNGVATAGPQADIMSMGGAKSGFEGNELVKGYTAGQKMQRPKTESTQPDLKANIGQKNFGASDLVPNERNAAHGGKVPVAVSPGEIYVPPSKVKEVASKKESASKVGEKIPGKAKVKGDSLKNDTVHTSLDSGGIVIPRSVTEGKDAERKCADFVAAHFNKLRSK